MIIVVIRYQFMIMHMILDSEKHLIGIIFCKIKNSPNVMGFHLTLRFTAL